jgi:hypothetical protein
MGIRLFFLWVVFLTNINFAFSQKAKIQFGKTDIALNEFFEITVSLEEERIKNYSAFPEIDGFVKKGTSSSTSTTIINGAVSTLQSITQRYQAAKEGNYSLKPFSMTVNNASASSNGTNIRVGPAKQGGYDPFADMWSNFMNRGNERSVEFVDVKEDAFFAVTSNKKEVFVGEGFTLTIAFYVAETNRAQMNFYDLSNQLTSILKTVKPMNAWEENFGIEEIVPEEVLVGGKKYSQYKIYQGNFYPLSAGKIDLPSAELKMIKYKVAKNPSFFGQNTQQDYKSFVSKESSVTVKDLPPHPLKGNIAVGNYRLSERLQSGQTETGKSLEYTFQIEGEGNISAITDPIIERTEKFDVYPPNVYQTIRRSGTVFGSKNYKYFVVPNEPGTHELKNYFRWIFFNTTTYRYDTLLPKAVIEAKGASVVSKMNKENELTGIYAEMSNYDNSLRSINETDWLNALASGFLMLVIAFCVYMVWAMKRSK